MVSPWGFAWVRWVLSWGSGDGKISGILLFLDFLGRYPVGPGGVLGGHRISDFGGGVAWDSRLNVKGILRWGSPK